jgi:hypothetical protein
MVREIRRKTCTCNLFRVLVVLVAVLGVAVTAISQTVERAYCGLDGKANVCAQIAEIELISSRSAGVPNPLR